MSEPYPPDLYAATHTGTPGDVAYYCAACTGASRVLELGCGFGRITHPVSAVCEQIVGLDLDEGLLELARRATAPNIRWVRGDMRRLDLPQTFDRVIIPHSGIYCLLDDDDVLACLRGALAHLAPGGQLLCDAYAADEFHAQAEHEDLDAQTLVPVTTVSARGRSWKVLERSTWDPTAQRIFATYVYIEEGGGQRLEGSIDQHYLQREQLRALLSRAGFEDVEIFGSFAHEPPSPHDAIWVARASAPSATQG